MKFNFDKKEYDTDNLSPQGKLCVEKLQNIGVQKQQISMQLNDLTVLQAHYSELLKKELPQEEEKKENKTGA
jgi:hypothetical protein